MTPHQERAEDLCTRILLRIRGIMPARGVTRQQFDEAIGSNLFLLMERDRPLRVGMLLQVAVLLDVDPYMLLVEPSTMSLDEEVQAILKTRHPPRFPDAQVARHRIVTAITTARKSQGIGFRTIDAATGVGKDWCARLTKSALDLVLWRSAASLFMFGLNVADVVRSNTYGVPDPERTKRIPQPVSRKGQRRRTTTKKAAA